jgi:hypothetical protein
MRFYLLLQIRADFLSLKGEENYVLFLIFTSFGSSIKEGRKQSKILSALPAFNY